ncbi:hypothetical protein FNH04_17375 [Streptomyces phyllanthi]|uniref:DUF4232 domain-containing protein n=1 Tax=Streptomyces phyllanthi TaxID=1803180 RepID=A0A5N8W2A0_9ACTN|nr:hypothetical protein [Streptomyces phyllanthi]
MALRRLLHEAVEELEPRDGTLEHLRRAVPARRARKRHATVGMAAAALFVCTAIPALVHVSNSAGSDADPSNVGHTSQTQGSDGQDKGASAGSGSSGDSAGSSKGTGKGDGKGDQGKGSSSGATGPAATASAENPPACTAAQLGGATASAGSPDAAGAVYGTFRVANISGTSCTVTGAGGVGAAAQGAADPSKISTASHVAGDRAAGLPDPSLSAAQLVLQPGAAYEVKFAWVPTETCPTSGGTGGGGTDPSPTPTPTDNTGENAGTTTEGNGVSPQLVTEDGVADGSVVVSHTPQVGAPSAATTVPNACAGTVYYTGLLAGA